METRELTSHKANGLNEALKIEVLDQPGSGGACHLYQITGFDTASNPSDPFVARYGKSSDHTTIIFQNGPIGEAGYNGGSIEALLAIVRDRLEGFQSGQYASDDNACALANVEAAMGWLQKRTRERIARGVEGTSAK